ALFLGAFLLAAATRGVRRGWVSGLAIGLSAVTALALASRLFLDVLPQGRLPESLAGPRLRLSYPVDYWNGLAVLVALVLPLVIATAARRRSALHSLALVPVPLVAGVIYLASSRSGALSAAVGCVAVLALGPKRWDVVWTIAVGAAASAATIATLVVRGDLVDHPHATDA